ncbi:hypothetical protein F0344_20110 [Streptomyces finlayi]|uniref:Serine/threonine protein kinase n=1 Tax=Streptomyces finlayi TaxID=67296 RepID=A0A7G7BMQ8_9ACTN|nr:hypothetical protein [Streptomyces finlayi]QNE76623.1 hypothetical protein F0344_20110 [Streptomyces finlayi]
MGRFVRTGSVVAASLVAALALTACGSDGDGGGGRKGGSSKGAGSDSGSGSGSGSGSSGSASGSAGNPGAGAAKLEGTWAGLTDGKAVALSVASGQAALVAEQHVCQGKVTGRGEVTLTLTCVDGNTDRTSGSVESNDGRTIVVSWNAGAKDTLTKTDGTQLPTELPGMPTP